jgi:hypothetical protein
MERASEDEPANQLSNVIKTDQLHHYLINVVKSLLNLDTTETLQVEMTACSGMLDNFISEPSLQKLFVQQKYVKGRM